MAPDERQERRGHESELRDRGGPGHRHEHGIAALCAPERHDGLHQREAEREHEGVMAELGDHLSLLAAAAP